MNVSLTTFVDFVNSNGIKKRDIVFFNLIMGPYAPSMDFYRDLRTAIVEMHRKNALLSSLSINDMIYERKKIKHYKTLIKGYRKWAARKRISYMKCDSRLFQLNGLEIRINPELILRINGRPTVIKLYFKEIPLTRDSANMIVTLLSLGFGEKNEYRGYQFAVLDIRQSKLFRLTRNTRVDEIIETLEMEADFWMLYQQRIRI